MRSPSTPSNAQVPWLSNGAEDPGLAFVSLWTSGPDPAVDGLLRIDALRLDEAGDFESFERWCHPFPGRDEPAASARMVREFGVTSADLERAQSGASAWAELTTFLGRRSLVVLDGQMFSAWVAHFEGRAQAARCVQGLVEFRDQWMPGRQEGARDAWLQGWLGSEHSRGGPGAISARDLQAALSELVMRVLELDPALLRLVSAAAMCASLALRETDPATALRFEFGLGLIERPARFRSGATQLFDELRQPADGAFALGQSEQDLRDPHECVQTAIEELEPAWTLDEERQGSSIPITTDDPKPFDARDLELLDDVFQVHLPALAAESGAELAYRAGQHEVARQVARTLGTEELLLVHAPTGTGKTLAYVVPALIWAARHGVRVGVSTYTRALQEQAMDREVPRALTALKRATGLGPNRLPCEPSVALLKGRANYVCWRALKLHVPGREDGYAAWLAWLTLVLFSLRDETGDLDRLAMRAAFGAGMRERESRELEQLARQVRAQVGCCQQRADRRTCGAEVARQRAERAHVVIANHAFALSRQAYFKHAVFDECEHLHEQAHAAWSHALSVEEMRQLLGRLSQEGRSSSRAPLDRLDRVAFPGTRGDLCAQQALGAWTAAASAVDELERQLGEFLSWRQQQERTRDAKDQHSLLREFVLGSESGALVAARVQLGGQFDALSTALAELAECLDSLPVRGIPRLRRQLELVRVDLDTQSDDLEAWMPIADGSVQYNEHTFYDVERDGRGRTILAARVLLPNEYLGRHYYPELKTAVLLSATTWLRGGFDGARAYLGLDRAAEPVADETRAPCSVRCVRAPDPFDYSRVVVALPTDLPSYTNERNAWNSYVRRFIQHLGERTRGRMLVLFTNQKELLEFGADLKGFFNARRIPFWYQGMGGIAKEELASLFRSRVDSILLGVDTFWYGADFPGETLEYLVIVKLPYGVPDRYHHAQCQALGTGAQRKQIYLPRALAKFRQGFGRLMRRETDRGCVFLLDPRAQEPRHRLFLDELPLADNRDPAGLGEWRAESARVLRATTDDCMHGALAHMDMLADVRRRGLDTSFSGRASENSREDSKIAGSDEIPF